MFGTLLESHAPRPRASRRGGVVVSVLLHAAVIGGAVVATGRAATARREPPPPPLIYVAPPRPAERVDLPRPTAARGPARGPAGPTVDSRRVSTDAPAPPIPAVPFSITLPTTSARAPSTSATEFASGGLRGTAVDADGGLGGGEPWSAATVERAAAPRDGNPVPRYPEALRAAGTEGQVLVRFVVDTAGRVEAGSVRVLRADDPQFAEAVRAVLPSFRFTPAEAGGRRVRQLVEAPFAFTVRR